MYKLKWKKIINSSVIFVAAITATLFGAYQLLHNSTSTFADDLNPTSVGVEFKVGEVTRNISAYDSISNEYTYEDTEEYLQNDVDVALAQDQSYMLRNYDTQQASGFRQAKNIYIGFGTPYDTAMSYETEGGSYGDYGVLVNNLNITATINGQQFATNYIEPTQQVVGNLGSTGIYYYHEYLDLTELKDNFTEEAITQTEGLYEFTFTYSYILENGSDYQVYGPYNYTYSFYLLNETTYANNYPTLSNTTAGNSDSLRMEQYYYNFQNTNGVSYATDLPTINFDASKYNVSYTRTRNTTTEVVTSSFSLNQDNSGTLTIVSSLNGTTTQTIPNVGGVYNTTLSWDTLGVYELKLQYVLQVPNQFKIIDSSELAAYDITRLVEGENPYENETFAKSYYKLHVFGLKSYFLKDGQNVLFNDNAGTQADYTAKINAATTINGVTNGLYAQVADGLYPTTNLPPISFDNFGVLSYDNITPRSKIYRYATATDLKNGTNATVIPFTKNSKPSQAGYYEVVVEYTYNDYAVDTQDNTTSHYQVFVFCINTTTPTVAIRVTSEAVQDLETDNVLSTQQYTNKNVYATFATPTYFQNDISLSVTKRGYDNAGAGTTTTLSLETQNQTSYSQLVTENGSYTLRVYYAENTNLYIEHNFIIDKIGIQDITISGINKMDATNPQDDDLYLVTDSAVVDLGDGLLINQPFTLTYAQKESGASITTTYQKIPFTAGLSGGQSINETTYAEYLQADYEINYAAISGNIPYVLDNSVFTTSVVNPANAFKEDNSYIYMFTITDQAGNQSKQYVVYDLTQPTVSVTPEIDNPYNIVSSATTVKWGTHKAVLIQDSSTGISNNAFNTLVGQETTLFQQLNGNYYMVVPITTATWTNASTGATYTFAQGEQTSVTILPDVTTTNQLTTFFSGEKSYTYSISDESNLNSITNIANNHAYNSNIWMNLDNSVALLYGKDLNANYNNVSGTEYGEALDWNKSATNAHQLRLTYKPGEVGTDYEVKSFTLTYYEFAQSDYTNIASATSTSYVLEQGEPESVYPFSSTPNIIDQEISLSTISIPGQTEGNNLRVVSEIINPINENGDVVTKPGYYVFRREYETTQTGDYSADAVVRFYSFVVDRDSIINIAGESVDEEVATITNPTSDSILYQTGSGINFKFTNSASDTTRYSAKQIQQFIEYVGSQELFTTNKLPARLVLPSDKYNTTQTLQKATDSSSYATYIANAASNNWSGLDYVITYNTGTTNRIIADTLNNNINGNQSYDSNYFTLTTSSTTQTSQLSFKLAGTYNVTLYSNTSAEVNTSVHTPIAYYFEFTILHEAPTGSYYSEYESDNSDMLISQKSESTNLVTYFSTNEDVLKFVFHENEDSYKASIDTNNITVKRTTSAGQTSTIYTRTNGSESVAGVYSQTLDPDTNLYIYTLDLSDFANESAYVNGATYTVTLRFIGNESDYVITSDAGSTNYYTRDFEIVVDRVKPQNNYNQLLASDALNYDAQNVEGLDTTDYFFAINGEYTFNRLNNSVLDSETLYVRPLTSTQGELPDYYYTITPDDDIYNNSSILPNHPRFSASDSDYTGSNLSRQYTYNLNTNGDYEIVAADIFELLVSQYGTQYFEVIERDEAGNYRVYAVQYTPNIIAPIINVEHTQIGEDSSTSTVLSDENESVVLSGTGFTISQIQSGDYFLKAIIAYGSTTLTITNNPYQNQDSQSFDEYINEILSALQFSETQIDAGYNINITFVNRYTDDYTIQYLVPGKMQTPIFTNLSSTQFRVTIPNDTTSTRITQFRVWKFENGAWSSSDLNSDSLGTPIRKGEPDGESLQGQSYVFGVGEYKFQLIDNFGRGEDMDEYKPEYYGLGVNNVNTINYRTNQVVQNSEGDDVVYTAGPVTLQYQINLYELKVYKYVVTDGVTERVYLSTLSTDSNITSEINNTTNVRTLNFNINTFGAEQRYQVYLTLQRTDQEFVYDFMLYKKLPSIVLRTLSGSYLNPNSSPFTENFLVTWSSEQLDFAPTVSLTRTYTGTDGKLTSETISHIANGYQVSEVGTYTATITNALGYTNSANNLSFQLVTGSVVVFEVLAISNGAETALAPSPITDILNVDGRDYVLYKYFALSTYDGSVANHEIQIRVNTNKALEIEEIENSLNPNADSLLYRVYGTGEYGYERYIEILFVDTEASNANFSNLAITQPVLNTETGTTENQALNLNQSLKTSAESITLTWDSYNQLISSNFVADVGNIIYADYYYNGTFIKTIYNYEQLPNTLQLTDAGVYAFVFYDLAGNQQTFNNYSTLTINLINNVTFLVNDAEPIENIIVNDSLTLSITNRSLYDSDPVVTATRDGEAITVTREGTSGYVYTFTTQGYYEITMTVVVSVGGENVDIVTTYHFIIINSNQKLLAFNVPQGYGFNIESVVYEGTDISYTLTSNELWLSQGTTGLGQYYVTLSSYISALDTTQNFMFSVFIYDEIPEITSSIDFGTETTKDIQIYYNPYKIYDSLGESILRFRLGNEVIDIDINSESANEITTFNLNLTGTYYIEILTQDGKLITSYKVIKNEPLNATSIIIISIAGALVVGLTVVFIILRRRVKFR